MRLAHERDGVAMANSIAEISRRVREGERISEVEIDFIVTGGRKAMEGFIECSFDTIAGVGSNGGIIHYSAGGVGWGGVGVAVRFSSSRS